MTVIHVFLAAPGSLAGEQKAFHQAVGACNEERGLALGRLFVPLTVSKKAYPQGTIDENIRLCSYYLPAAHDTLPCQQDSNLAIGRSSTEVIAEPAIVSDPRGNTYPAWRAAGAGSDPAAAGGWGPCGMGASMSSLRLISVDVS